MFSKYFNKRIPAIVVQLILLSVTSLKLNCRLEKTNIKTANFPTHVNQKNLSNIPNGDKCCNKIFHMTAHIQKFVKQTRKLCLDAYIFLKSDWTNNMDHMRISVLEPSSLFRRLRDTPIWTTFLLAVYGKITISFRCIHYTWCASRYYFLFWNQKIMTFTRRRLQGVLSQNNIYFQIVVEKITLRDKYLGAAYDLLRFV